MKDERNGFWGAKKWFFYKKNHVRLRMSEFFCIFAVAISTRV